MEMKLDTIYSKYHDKVLGYFLMAINNRENSEELCNDVFLRVDKHLEDYDEELSSINTWIFNIAKNILIDYYRAKKERYEFLVNSVDSDGIEINALDRLPINNSLTPIDTIILEESRSKIRASFTSLPNHYKRIANLFFNCQMSQKDICAKTGLPLGTVKIRIMRAKDLMKKHLENI